MGPLPGQARVRTCIKCAVLEPFSQVSPSACPARWGVPCLFGRSTAPLFISSSNFCEVSEHAIAEVATTLQHAIRTQDIEMARESNQRLASLVAARQLDAHRRGGADLPAAGVPNPGAQEVAQPSSQPSASRDIATVMHMTTMSGGSAIRELPDMTPVPKAALMRQQREQEMQQQQQLQQPLQHHTPTLDVDQPAHTQQEHVVQSLQQLGTQQRDDVQLSQQQ
eukprot:10033913-Alexandrium_andersonii.AAC.1